MKISYPY